MVSRLIAVATSLLLLAPGVGTTGQAQDGIPSAGVYVDAGDGQASYQRHADRSALTGVRTWQIRLYKRGMPKTSRNRWGVISGRSAGEVLEQLRERQLFEDQSDRFFKRPPRSSTLTYFNPLGPVAVLGTPDVVPPPKPVTPNEDGMVFTRLDPAYNTTAGTYVRLLERIGRAGRDIAQINKQLAKALKEGPQDPRSRAGSVLREYRQSLEYAADALSKLQDSYFHPALDTQDRLMQRLLEFEQAVRSLEERGPAVKTVALAKAPSAASLSRYSGKGQPGPIMRKGGNDARRSGSVLFGPVQQLGQLYGGFPIASWFVADTADGTSALNITVGYNPALASPGSGGVIIYYEITCPDGRVQSKSGSVWFHDEDNPSSQFFCRSGNDPVAPSEFRLLSGERGTVIAVIR